MIFDIIKKFDTRDPFRIAKDYGIIVIECDLGDICGFYTRLNNVKFIFLNDRLNDSLRLFTCAHELGHAFLHPDEVTPKLTRKSFSATARIEREANEFATLLLIDGSHNDDYVDTTYGVIRYYQLPKEMVRFVEQHKEQVFDVPKPFC